MCRFIPYFIVSSGILTAQEFPHDNPFSLERESPNIEEVVEIEPILDAGGKAFFKAHSAVLNAKILKLCDERSLHDREDNEAVFRLILSPTFGKPLVLRSFLKGERPFFEVKRLSGRGGYDLGEVEITGSVEFSDEIHKIIWKTLRSPGFHRISSLTFEQRYGLSGLDGTWISFEIARDGVYRVAELWSPNKINKYHREFGITQKDVDEFINLYTKICDLVGVNFGGQPTSPQHNP